MRQCPTPYKMFHTKQVVSLSSNERFMGRRIHGEASDAIAAPAPGTPSALSTEALAAAAPATTVPSTLGPLPGGTPTLSIPTQPVPTGESGNSTSVPDYSQCGGSGVTCPLADKAACADAAYLACAVATSACTRINQYYWQARSPSCLCASLQDI